VIVDSSALIAILNDEPDGPALARAIANAEVRLMSAASYLECSIVIDRSPDPVFRARLDDLLRQLEIEVVPVTFEQARLAREAHRAFGRGSGHPARLNFGDCFAYALARERNQPLLYKGDDFAQTDIPLVGRREERRRLSEAMAAYGGTAD
jgi:ribonuclease VapC